MLKQLYSLMLTGMGCVVKSTEFKTHHYIIFFVRQRHSKPGMESYCASSTDQL